MNWRDPTDDILNALNEIMFRAALASSDVSKFAFMNLSYKDTTSFYEAWPVNISTGDTGMPVPRMLQMQQTSNITIFKSNYSYLAAALAVMMQGFGRYTHASWVLGNGSPDISQSTRDSESIQRRSASGAESD
jgi:hypothetical protein